MLLYGCTVNNVSCCCVAVLLIACHVVVGLYSYTPAAWLNYVYPKLTPADKPVECIQNSGDIFYVVSTI